MMGSGGGSFARDRYDGSDSRSGSRCGPGVTSEDVTGARRGQRKAEDHETADEAVGNVKERRTESSLAWPAHGSPGGPSSSYQGPELARAEAMSEAIPAGRSSVWVAPRAAANKCDCLDRVDGPGRVPRTCPGQAGCCRRICIPVKIGRAHV